MDQKTEINKDIDILIQKDIRILCCSLHMKSGEETKNEFYKYTHYITLYSYSPELATELIQCAINACTVWDKYKAYLDIIDMLSHIEDIYPDIIKNRIRNILDMANQMILAYNNTSNISLILHDMIERGFKYDKKYLATIIYVGITNDEFREFIKQYLEYKENPTPELKLILQKSKYAYDF